MMNKEQGDRHVPHDYKTWDCWNGRVFVAATDVKMRLFMILFLYFQKRSEFTKPKQSLS